MPLPLATARSVAGASAKAPVAEPAKAAGAKGSPARPPEAAKSEPERRRQRQ